MPATTEEKVPNDASLTGAQTAAKDQQNIFSLTAAGKIKKIMAFEATVDFASAADGVGETVQITGANGVELGDVVLGVSIAIDLEDMILTAYVQADNVIEIRLQNESTSTVNLASTTVRVVVADVT